jgi:hypothetical protein
MAVQAYLTNYASSPGFGEKLEPGRNAQEMVSVAGYTTVAAADDDTSTYLLIKSVPSSFRPVRATIQTDAITGGTDYDIGFYNSVTGVVVDKDILVDGQTLATASRTLDGLSNVDLADLGALKSIAELLGLTPTTAKATYDIVLTGNTVGSAAGDVRYILEGFAA